MNLHERAMEALERGNRARREKRPDDARTAFAEAADLFRRLEAPADLVHALTRQAQIERDGGFFDKALEYQLQALAVSRTLNDRKTLAHVIRHAGDIFQASSRHGEADPCSREMLYLYRSAADVAPLEMANAIRSVALHKEYAGDKIAARLLWQEARERYGALDELFLSLTGEHKNPGVTEAVEHLAALEA